MDPITTTSGKTLLAKTRALRQARLPILVDRTDDLIEMLDRLADESYATIRMMRERGNALRLKAIAAKQLSADMRKLKKLDLEL